MARATDRARRWAARLIDRISTTSAYDAPAVLFGRRAAVDGASMYPVLRPGDRVLFDRLAYLLGPPRRGDVVLARGPERRLIKLVAGLPGETLEVARDRLWVDGRTLDLPDGRPMVGSLPGRWELGPGEYFLLSHAVAVGIDSRHFGPVGRDRLLGRGLRVYWPPERRRPVGTVAFRVRGDG